ncbi:Dipeptidyl peptidase 4 [Melipona quadrifasciata]|uniref:Dipeptidyl peptidase 4 n=1 Tax=Melipona quadrifasciata TaxID=166423 RepID=A0A0M9A083_9HYME|nr:Dipeptidyl peptidase 4 [Melipona quadrifasciata]
MSSHRVAETAECSRLPVQLRSALRVVQAQCQTGKFSDCKILRPVNVLQLKNCRMTKRLGFRCSEIPSPRTTQCMTSRTSNHHTPLRLHTSRRMQQTRLQHAAWLGNTTGLLMVSDNDIYVRIAPSAAEDVRITETGVPGVIYNGVPDWLYQEEVLPRPEATWPSPDGTHLLYASFNDTKVTALEFPWRGTFPPSKSVRYPTPGSPNPEVDLWIMELSNLTNFFNGNGSTTNSTMLFRTRLKPPPALDGQKFEGRNWVTQTKRKLGEGEICFDRREYYLISAGWVGDDSSQVAVVWMTRSQNLSVVSACRAPTWECEETHSERAPEGQWLDAQPHPLFAPDGDSFLLLASVQEGDKEHFTHIKHVTLTQQRIAVLSHGRYEVRQTLTANHVSREKLAPLSYTCFARPAFARFYYTNCTHFGASVSPAVDDESQGYYVLYCEGPGLPLAGMHLMTTHKMIRVLYDTRIQRGDKLSQLALPTRRSFEVPATTTIKTRKCLIAIISCIVLLVPLPQGWKAQVQLLLPPSWREELRDAAFPVLVEVNGRPGSEAVTDRFRIDWGTYMSSHNDVVYIRLDVRGARGQGKRDLFRRIGGVEVQDQLTVLRHLLKTLKYLDVTRVGVWGWGYGGYVTAMVLGSQENVFKCGVAVNPIADWLYYNSAFTERVLGAPAENYKGYVEADLTQRARLVPSHSLYLLHGLADLTAPYTHGVAFAKALSEAGIIFRYQLWQENVYRDKVSSELKSCLSEDDDAGEKYQLLDDGFVKTKH